MRSCLTTQAHKEPWAALPVNCSLRRIISAMLNDRSGYPCPNKCAVPYGGIVFVFRRYRAPAKAELFRMPTHPSQPKGAPACTKSRAVFRSPFV